MWSVRKQRHLQDGWGITTPQRGRPASKPDEESGGSIISRWETVTGAMPLFTLSPESQHCVSRYMTAAEVSDPSRTDVRKGRCLSLFSSLSSSSSPPSPLPLPFPSSPSFSFISAADQLHLLSLAFAFPNTRALLISLAQHKTEWTPHWPGRCCVKTGLPVTITTT